MFLRQFENSLRICYTSQDVYGQVLSHLHFFYFYSSFSIIKKELKKIQVFSAIPTLLLSQGFKVLILCQELSGISRFYILTTFDKRKKILEAERQRENRACAKESL